MKTYIWYIDYKNRMSRSECVFELCNSYPSNTNTLNRKELQRQWWICFLGGLVPADDVSSSKPPPSTQVREISTFSVKPAHFTPARWLHLCKVHSTVLKHRGEAHSQKYNIFRLSRWMVAWIHRLGTVSFGNIRVFKELTMAPGSKTYEPV